MTRVIVSGALGRMGQAILRLGEADESIEVLGGLESDEKADLEYRKGGVHIPLRSDLRQFSDATGAVLIEFTTPEATVAHAIQASHLGINMVIGTTGLDENEMEAVRDASTRIAILLAPNMSLGVNVLLGIVARLSSALPEFDIEIVEMHHRLKKDAPSGTALALAKAAADGRNQDIDKVGRHGRSGLVGERSREEIGVLSLRGGDVVGDHTVIFAGTGERVELLHRAASRDTFAAGALRAAKFLEGKTSGLYNMQDVLGLA